MHFVFRTHFKSRLAAAQLIALVVMMSINSHKSDVSELMYSMHCIAPHLCKLYYLYFVKYCK